MTLDTLIDEYQFFKDLKLLFSSKTESEKPVLLFFPMQKAICIYIYIYIYIYTYTPNRYTHPYTLHIFTHLHKPTCSQI